MRSWLCMCIIHTGRKTYMVEDIYACQGKFTKLGADWQIVLIEKKKKGKTEMGQTIILICVLLVIHTIIHRHQSLSLTECRVSIFSPCAIWEEAVRPCTFTRHISFLFFCRISDGQILQGDSCHTHLHLHKFKFSCVRVEGFLTTNFTWTGAASVCRRVAPASLGSQFWFCDAE